MLAECERVCQPLDKRRAICIIRGVLPFRFSKRRRGNAEKGRPLEGRRFRFRLSPAGFRRPNGGLFFVKPYASTRVACYNGLIVQAAINNLLPLFYVILQRDFNVSVERLGMLTAVNFITQLR